MQNPGKEVVIYHNYRQNEEITVIGTGRYHGKVVAMNNLLCKPSEMLTPLTPAVLKRNTKDLITLPDGTPVFAGQPFDFMDPKSLDAIRMTTKVIDLGMIGFDSCKADLLPSEYNTQEPPADSFEWEIDPENLVETPWKL